MTVTPQDPTPRPQWHYSGAATLTTNPGDQEEVFKNSKEALGTRGQSLALGVQGLVLRSGASVPSPAPVSALCGVVCKVLSFVLWRAVGGTMDKEDQETPNGNADRATAADAPTSTRTSVFSSSRVPRVGPQPGPTPATPSPGRPRAYLCAFPAGESLTLGLLGCID